MMQLQLVNHQAYNWKDLFSSNAGGSTYSFTVELGDSQSIDTEAVCAEPYNKDNNLLKELTTQQINFKLIRATTGEVVCGQLLS